MALPPAFGDSYRLPELLPQLRPEQACESWEAESKTMVIDCNPLPAVPFHRFSDGTLGQANRLLLFDSTSLHASAVSYLPTALVEHLKIHLFSLELWPAVVRLTAAVQEARRAHHYLSSSNSLGAHSYRQSQSCRRVGGGGAASWGGGRHLHLRPPA